MESGRGDAIEGGMEMRGKRRRVEISRQKRKLRRGDINKNQ